MYGPNFSEFASVSVRRLAWALGVNMGAAINRMAGLLPAEFDKSLVCQRCRDQTKCRLCAFSKTVSENDRANLLTM
jgi:hypothetical protein